MRENSLNIARYIRYKNTEKNELFLADNMIILVLSGTKILHFKDKSIEANADEMLLLKSGNYVMSEAVNGHYEAILFNYDDDSLLNIIKKYEINLSNKNLDTIENHLKITKDANLKLLQETIKSYISSKMQNTEILKLKLEEIFLNLIHSKNAKKFIDFLSLIKSDNGFKLAIERGYSPDVNILSFAKSLNITEDSFRNRFKEVFGTTPKKWQINKNLEKAKILLEKTDYNVSQVCILSGFDNISHFIQSFKSTYGTTPKKLKINKNYDFSNSF